MFSFCMKLFLKIVIIFDYKYRFIFSQYSLLKCDLINRETFIKRKLSEKKFSDKKIPLNHRATTKNLNQLFTFGSKLQHKFKK